MKHKVCLQVYIIENAELRYSCGLIPLKKLKRGTVGNLTNWKSQNKVRLEIYFIEKSKIR